MSGMSRIKLLHSLIEYAKKRGSGQFALISKKRIQLVFAAFLVDQIASQIHLGCIIYPARFVAQHKAKFWQFECQLLVSQPVKAGVYRDHEPSITASVFYFPAMTSIS